MKKRNLCSVAVTMMCICLLTWGHGQAVSPPEKDGTFPDIAFPVPKDAGHRAYLGLPQGGNFKIPQIKADVVIIEVFNMY
jgi:hypothetical protein